MFTVSCKNDCIKVQCVKFCTTVRLSEFSDGISRNEVEPDLECQLQLYFGFIERDCSKLLYFLLLFVLHLLPFARQKQ